MLLIFKYIEISSCVVPLNIGKFNEWCQAGKPSQLVPGSLVDH